MLDEPRPSRVSRRRDATKAEILDAAWAVAAEKGLAGLTLQDVASRVGMRPPSLYSYFDSKLALYDAMFADGYRALLQDMRDMPGPSRTKRRETMIRGARRFMAFCRANVPRYQLLFQRTIPGFEPSADSWEIALQAYQIVQAEMEAMGISSPRLLDLWTGISTGLIDQQISNDPTGDRWERLIPDTVDMFLATVDKRGRR